MSKTLAIDTSSFVMGIAVTEGDRTLGEVTTNIKKNHSIRLMPAIDQLMSEVDVKPNELEKIVVANGPGSYTGVRIGVTTAKTLAWSLNIPIIGVSSIAVLAQAGRFFQGVISPIMDARRGQVYTGHYETKGIDVLEVTNDRLIMLEDWLVYLQELRKPVLFVGQDVSMHEVMIREKLGDHAHFATGSMALPRPAELARLGGALTADIDSVHSFVPNYLQLAEAEANWQKAQKEKGMKND
ncbi:tRNA (adenosine(37)-N6)-threonylcarbamoyltransferase complex dimerization subunit type 1 TsaB [Halalkalibacter alkaliphilus]|uniref:tRNA (Adenosine(37)-N6)-threonylcarbamoyltransferase complex dimerization subunit type 1 TsaB n=1 Tax=Halalkalibacter alkaliphilus TaxID=2917993 RepID=A0A9X2I5T7_9BACI|nr:tRNA (adenosine(37)-N6)-threonylcarbamoyltransferase complex dimerization subunit type 1 TsaB [Halalkalibacter alkaliphilus]MCL7748821.1 tRNA (adenosine(37)-N6)-threonylcarbamoyltransferase complex dimerization subunit type 1 TsaB [Halalkalibacter alkaliphilus]